MPDPINHEEFFPLPALYELSEEQLREQFAKPEMQARTHVTLHYVIQFETLEADFAKVLEADFAKVLKVVRALQYTQVTHLTLSDMDFFARQGCSTDLFSALNSETITHLSLPKMFVGFITGNDKVPSFDKMRLPNLRYLDLSEAGVDFSTSEKLREFFTNLNASPVTHINLNLSNVMRFTSEELLSVLTAAVSGPVEYLRLNALQLNTLSADDLDKLLKILQECNATVDLGEYFVENAEYHMNCLLSDVAGMQHDKKQEDHLLEGQKLLNAYLTVISKIIDSSAVKVEQGKDALKDISKKLSAAIVLLESKQLFIDANNMPGTDVLALYSYAPKNQAYKDIITKYTNTLAVEKIKEAIAKFETIGEDDGDVYTAAQEQIAKLQALLKPAEETVEEDEEAFGLDSLGM